jgi:hypothetical protein
MSASSKCRNAVLVLAFGAAGTVLAAEAEEPEMEFVEYLGLWEESDEDWLMVEHQMAIESEEERIDPVPEGEESREDDDES